MFLTDLTRWNRERSTRDLLLHCQSKTTRRSQSFNLKERISPTAIHQRDFGDDRIESSPIHRSEATGKDQDRWLLNTAWPVRTIDCPSETDSVRSRTKERRIDANLSKVEGRCSIECPRWNWFHRLDRSSFPVARHLVCYADDEDGDYCSSLLARRSDSDDLRSDSDVEDNLSLSLERPRRKTTSISVDPRGSNELTGQGETSDGVSHSIDEFDVCWLLTVSMEFSRLHSTIRVPGKNCRKRSMMWASSWRSASIKA